ncbi:MAG: ABC transporter ATP-binding protein, partial [Cellvibrionales bacterium]|nr:ABC transporter ATP-binding protein [Cellvibrionales bacterium]
MKQAQNARMLFNAVSLSRDSMTVLDDINLTLPAGEITALLGPNGAGKTSLLDCASGVMKCSAGRVLLNEK